MDMVKVAALNNILAKVYLPTFLAKLATYDIRPNSVEDIQNLIKLAAILSQTAKTFEQGMQKKTANAQSVVIRDATRALESMMGIEHVDTVRDNMIGRVLLQSLATDPELLKSAIVVGNMQ